MSEVERVARALCTQLMIDPDGCVGETAVPNWLASEKQAKAAIAAIDEARGWRPIESAPRDASHILLLDPKDDLPRAKEVWWAQDYEGGPGYWSTPFGPAGRGYTILDRPHLLWQPLPAPPS